MDLCKIGIHDWQDLMEPMSDFQISMKLNERPSTGGIVKHHKKNCLKCGKYVDNLSKRIEKIKDRIDINKRRESKAKEVFCKKFGGK